MKPISELQSFIPIVDSSGVPTPEFLSWASRVSRAPIEIAANGSPEGVISARMSTRYLQSDAGVIWVKATESGNEGWVLE